MSGLRSRTGWCWLGCGGLVGSGGADARLDAGSRSDGWLSDDGAGPAVPPDDLPLAELGRPDLTQADQAVGDLAGRDATTEDPTTWDGAAVDLAAVDRAAADLAAVDLAAEEVAAGDAATEDLAVVDLATGDLATADLAIADLATADLATADLAIADLATDGGPPVPPPPLFDLPLLRDPAAAACSFTEPRPTLQDGVLLTVYQVSYLSYEARDGTLWPIRIRGYAAWPSVPGEPRPGVVQAHGLGGYAEESHATGLAALLGLAVLAYTGPGGGTIPDNTSEGLPATDREGYRLFDTVADPRGSWFWAHTVAGLRALTCLAERPEVDAARLGMTGFSAGGVATLLGGAVDDRIRAAVPLSASLAWDVAIRSPEAWQLPLLERAGLDPASPEWQTLIGTLIRADALLPATRGAVLMINGTTDEFFPLTAHLATLQALPGAGHRTSLAANFDHGCYSLTGLEPAERIEERAELRRRGGQRLWFGHHLGSDRAFPTIPQAPALQVQPAAGGVLALAAVDSGGAAHTVEEVRIWWSNDDCLAFVSDRLEEQHGIWSRLLPVALQANSVYYLDVTYRTTDLLFPTRFSISSPPVVPAGLIPRLRDQETCQ